MTITIDKFLSELPIVESRGNYSRMISNIDAIWQQIREEERF